MYKFIENYLFKNNKLYHKLISIILLPLSILYTIIVLYIRFWAKPKDFSIPIISVGNIIIGGSGKTPIIIELAKRYKNSAVVMRGYGRKSKGLKIVSINGEIKVDVDISGDEAMLISKMTNSTVIVSEDREIGILEAKKIGCSLILLDDGFGKVNIKKFDILIEPEERFIPLTIPSGPYREPPFCYRFANFILKENIDFIRNTDIINKKSKMVLITAISKPYRLDRYIDSSVIAKYYLKDHEYISNEYISALIKKHNADSVLMTQKDFVKIKNPPFEISIINLNIEFYNNNLFQAIDKFLYHTK
jgi:tetraacyldisaccharide 4'-kinase